MIFYYPSTVHLKLLCTMIKKAYIGIDASYNSTGVVIKNNMNSKIHYIHIAGESTPHSPSVVYSLYNKHYANTKNFSDDEQSRIKSSHQLWQKIKYYIQLYIPDMDEYNFTLEGNVMSSFGMSRFNRLTDMVLLNTMIKYFIMIYPKSKLTIFTPTEVKKMFTGNGRGNKELMMETFQSIMGDNFIYSGKWDDVADGYALAWICKHLETPEELKPWNIREREKVEERKRNQKLERERKKLERQKIKEQKAKEKEIAKQIA